MPELGSDLRRHRLASPWAGPRDIVFASKAGTSPDQRNVANRGLKLACREAGLEGVSFHVLRHTFASILIAQGQTSSSCRASSPRQRCDHAEGLRALVRRGQACGDGAAAAERGLRDVLRRREQPGKQLGLDV